MEEESVERTDVEKKAAMVVTATTITTTTAGVLTKIRVEPRTLPIVNASGARRCTKENAENLGHRQIMMGKDSTSKNSFR